MAVAGVRLTRRGARLSSVAIRYLTYQAIGTAIQGSGQ